MDKYVSGRQRSLKVGIKSYSENSTSLEVIGNVGIGTTLGTSKLTVVGDGLFTGIVTAAAFSGDGSKLTGIIAQGSGVQVADDNINVGIAATINFGAGLAVSFANGAATVDGSSVSNLVQDISNNRIYYPVLSPVTSGFISSISVSSNAIVFNPATNSLGIGTTNPQRLLHVVGYGASNGIRLGDIDFFNFDTTPSGSGSPTFRSIINNGDTILRMIPNGNGRSQFEFFGNDYFAAGISTQWTNVRINRIPNKNEFRIDTSQAQFKDASPLVLETGGNATVTSPGLNPNQLYLATTGYVGIGTSQPTSKLTVQGDGLFTGIVTAAAFSGDGSRLTRVSVASSILISENRINQNQYLTYAPSIGSTTGLGVTTNLVFNPSTGNLGIGTTNPTSKLDVDGNGKFSGIITASAFYGSGIGLTGLVSNEVVDINNNQLYYPILSPVTSGTVPNFSVSSSSIVFNPANSYLGIGTTNPITYLDLPFNSATQNTAQFGAFGIQGFNDGNGFISVNGYWNGSAWVYRKTGYTSLIQFLDGNIFWRTVGIPTTGTAGAGTTTLDLYTRFAVNRNGTISINKTDNETTNPNLILDIRRADLPDEYPYVSRRNPFLLGITTSGDVGIGTTNPLGYIQVGSSSTSDVFVLSRSGNLGIGTTNPTSKLTVRGDGLFTGIVTAAAFSGDGSRLTGIIGQGSGVVIRDDGNIVGTAVTIDFGNNLSVSSFSSGITTISSSITISPNTTNQNQYLTYASSIGSTTGLGVTTNLVFNPSTGNLGIGTTNPTSTLTVSGSGRFSGIVTATAFYGSGIGLTGIVSNEIIEVSGDSVYYPMLSSVTSGTIPNFSVSSKSLAFIPNRGSSGALGIGTTNPTSALHFSGVGSTQPSNDGARFRIGDFHWDNLYTTIHCKKVRSEWWLEQNSEDDDGVDLIFYKSRGVPGVEKPVKLGDNVFRLTARPYRPGAVGVGTTITLSDWTGESAGSIEVNVDEVTANNAFCSIDFKTKNITRFKILSGGNIGIGTTNPTSKLTVQGDGLFTGIVTAAAFYGSGIGLTELNAIPNTISDINNTLYYPILSPVASGTISSISVSNNSIVFNPTTNSLGIGITNPTSKLTVQGDGLFTGIVTAAAFSGDGSLLTGVSAASSITISPNTTNQNQYLTYASSIGSTTGLGVTTNLVFNPATGNLGIGTTNPTTTLDVNGDINTSTDIKINGQSIRDSAINDAIIFSIALG